jgi:lipopolysaccharide export LptBFGC system permease protein LptF
MLGSLGWIIPRYILGAILPYFISAWLLLSVVLFVQQAGRYSDIFFGIDIPAEFVWQLSLALIPSVIAFTCPIAVLVGTIIGLTKMQADSELVAMRAAGKSNIQILIPVALVGLLLSAFAFWVNSEGVPWAARMVRTVALQSALKKLESPIQPGTFNSDIGGLTIYVNAVDLESGRWKDIFIYQESKNEGVERLITSRGGRIDTTGDASELVLENASVATIPIEAESGKYVIERLGEIRVAIKTKRSELVERLTRAELTPEELGIRELGERSETLQGNQRTEAQILWQRRVLLSVTPLIFCVLGALIVLRFSRSGRGFGIAAALVVLLGFYALAFIGEQLVRAGAGGAMIASLLPVLGSIAVVAWFSFAPRLEGFRVFHRNEKEAPVRDATNRRARRSVFVGITAGLGDLDILRNVVKNFVLAVSFLSSIFLIFTAFELWRFAGAIENGSRLLAQYLTFLFPFIYIQIAPSAAMVATLATYSVKSRQNEIVTWTAAGQSVYRLLLPCFMFMLLVGTLNFVIQERMLPSTNRLQEQTRAVIRNRGVAPATQGRQWVSEANRIYSFLLASDTEKQHRGDSVTRAPASVAVYELNDRRELQTLFRAPKARWHDGSVVLSDSVEIVNYGVGEPVATKVAGYRLSERADPFTKLRTRPAHMTTSDLRAQIDSIDSETERNSMRVIVERRHTTPFLPLVVALFTAPFSLSLSRKGKAAMVAAAVGLWLLYTGVGSILEQLAQMGSIDPRLAIWAPLLGFSFIGVFLITRLRT